MSQTQVGAFAVLLVASSAGAGAAELSSREYKVRLAPTEYTQGDVKRQVGDQWTNTVLPRLTAAVGAAVTGTASRKTFDSGDRTIRYFDTDKCTLSASGAILRERVSGKKTRYTVKVRTPDLAAARKIVLDGKEELEADIVPDFSNGARWRTIYSVSAEPSFPGGPPTTLSALTAEAKGLKDIVPSTGSENFVPAARIIRESNFDDIKFTLAENKTIEFSQAVWFVEGTPKVAEISFKLKGDGNVPGETQRQIEAIYDVLKSLPTALKESDPKTKFGLRETCAAALAGEAVE